MLRGSGGVAPGQQAITAANIKDFTPSPGTAEKVRQAFQAKGFDVGAIVGNSFSITATQAIFEKEFRTRLSHTERGGIQTVKTAKTKDKSEDYELPLTPLAPDIAAEVIAVTFTPPPDFGPVSFQ